MNKSHFLATLYTEVRFVIYLPSVAISATDSSYGYTPKGLLVYTLNTANPKKVAEL